MKIFLFNIFIVLFSGIEAKIIKYDPLGLKQKSWDFKKVCKSMGYKNPLLVEALNLAWLDCVGNRVSARDFCLKASTKAGATPFIRALVDKEKQKVICYSGHSAILSIACDRTHGRYCRDKNIGCDQLKKHFAHGLETIRSTLNKEKKVRQLNCYYQVKKGWKL
ncbi:MAG: hypothetical protein OXB84_03785 [Halobacteriovoraceae bacterium]|nr:hypothetical protein [Halobacteriovoraceae bacterium]